MTKLDGILAICLAISLSHPIIAQDDSKPPVSLEFVKFESTQLISSGKPVTVGWFRIRNNTDETIQYCDHGGAADPLIQRPVDGGWTMCHWNWCGMGKRPRDLAAGKSVYFYIDPEYYRTEYGDKLRFGFFVPDSDARTPSFTWTQMVELPDVDNPDELPYCRFVFPKSKAESESNVGSTGRPQS